MCKLCSGTYQLLILPHDDVLQTAPLGWHVTVAISKTAAQQETSEGVTPKIYDLTMNLHFVWCWLEAGLKILILFLDI